MKNLCFNDLILSKSCPRFSKLSAILTCSNYLPFGFSACCRQILESATYFLTKHWREKAKEVKLVWSNCPKLRMAQSFRPLVFNLWLCNVLFESCTWVLYTFCGFALKHSYLRLFDLDGAVLDDLDGMSAFKRQTFQLRATCIMPNSVQRKF